MGSSNVLAINLVVVAIMLGFFVVMDRYAKRHPYGTGHFAKVEEQRRREEARHEHRRKPTNPEAKAQNEAVMAALLASLQSPDSPTTAAGFDPTPLVDERTTRRSTELKG